MSGSDHQFICDQLSDAAFEAVQRTVSGTGVTRRDLVIDEAKLAKYKQNVIVTAAASAYVDVVARRDIFQVTEAVGTRYKQLIARNKASVILSSFSYQATAFKTQYVGSADVQLKRYITKCWSAYRDNRKEFIAPWLTITQSSGFGKSRILQQLAERGQSYDTNTVDMTVLYLCMDNIEGATGYPRTTTKLRDWLFPRECCTADSIAAGLLKAYTYAVNHCDAKTQWRALFDDSCDDGAIVEELKKVVIYKNTGKPDPGKSSESGSKATSKTPLLVVAIDEARALFHNKNSQSIDKLQMLQQALVKLDGDVFAVLVGTYLPMNALVPDFQLDPDSSRYDGGSSSNKAQFPPFILTRTMDIMLERPRGLPYSQNRVLDTNAKRVWEQLVSMGRPMWFSLNQNTMTSKEKQFILNKVAASKLLLGQDPSNAASYNNLTLHGVSSLFCRVGVQPRTNSSVATRLVSDFMSVLHYVTYRNDDYISSYASDPILTFGAAHMWYQLETPVLESHILPQFKIMVDNNAIDPADTSEIVARIFLLLIMDATIMKEKVVESAVVRDHFVFTGQFSKVLDFVDTLNTKSPVVCGLKSKAYADKSKWYANWREHWVGWNIGFSHFVDLSGEPDADMLWKMLDRRAAGILPSTVEGAEVVIPIFCDIMVSIVVVQVKNRTYTDITFPHSVLESLTPEHIFSTSELKRTQHQYMIRLYMSLCEEPNPNSTPAQSVVIPEQSGTRSQDHQHQDFDCILCVRGMFTLNDTDDNLNATHKRWPFMSVALIKQLQEIANSLHSVNTKQQEATNSAWPDNKKKIKDDFANRDEIAERRLSLVLSKENAINIASKTLDLFPSPPVQRGPARAYYLLAEW